MAKQTWGKGSGCGVRPPKEWNEQETEYLSEHWLEVSLDVLMETLGRTQQEIFEKAKEIGLLEPVR